MPVIPSALEEEEDEVVSPIIFGEYERGLRQSGFELDLSQVLKGWDVGVKTTKKEEIAICSPECAYGKASSPPKIPPDATFKFKAEITDWVRKDLSPLEDKGITRQQIKAGEGYLTGDYSGKSLQR
ncbi:hypothetical protein QAD02_008036 [Eretmocerus hayati]|uniref:Uncharacterized protein n=1 Tax=Eretmocerus hayati TaxID=131215 RepID=A0ACC2N5P5_9HYME|nr:hypothetical protein QAD02_008036 [Eretmocerus hayati]